VRERRAQVERVLEFVGLPFSAECELPETVFRGFGPGIVERSRPIDTLSLHRWSDRLSEEEEDEVWAVTREAMERFGYERHPPAPPKRRAAPIELDAPIVAVGRGGSGTRLLSPMLEMMGIFLGNRRNASNDSLEWAELIYEMTLASCTDGDPETHWTPLLHQRARDMLEQGKWRDGQRWGWKLPETMLVVREVARAFPNARILHLVRHPVDTCLRRPHLTSRFRFLIGAAVLRAAYRACGRDERLLESDPLHIHTALSWEYQVSRVVELGRSVLGPERYLEVRYEELCRDPERIHAQIAAFVGADGSRPPPRELFDASGRARWSPPDPRADEVWQICGETGARLGYSPPPPALSEGVADCCV
jgi:hypothetical protein